MADAGVGKDDARMPASGSATQQTLPEEKRQPLRHGAELHSAAKELQQELDAWLDQRPPWERTEPASGAATAQTQPEDKKQQLPTEELQQTELADAGVEEYDETMPDWGSATKQTLPEEQTQPLPEYKQLAYSIVNELLDKIRFDNPEVEHMLLAALEDESPRIPQMVHRIREMFEPIFFHYPLGLKDRSVWEPRDTGKYIRE